MRQRPTSPSRDGRPGPLLAVLVLAGGGYSLVQSLVVPALPTLQYRLHTTQTGATWVFTAFILAAAVATRSRAARRYLRPPPDPALGPPRALRGILIAALTTSLVVMVGTRACRESAPPSSRSPSASSATSSPPRSVAHGTAWMSAVLGGGGVWIGLLCGPILEHLSYHWLYSVPLVVTMASGVTAYPSSPSGRRHAPGRSAGWQPRCSQAGSCPCSSPSARCRTGAGGRPRGGAARSPLCSRSGGSRGRARVQTPARRPPHAAQPRCVDDERRRRPDRVGDVQRVRAGPAARRGTCERRRLRRDGGGGGDLPRAVDVALAIASSLSGRLSTRFAPASRS